MMLSRRGRSEEGDGKGDLRRLGAPFDGVSPPSVRPGRGRRIVGGQQLAILAR
jgi:hypothetical protein